MLKKNVLVTGASGFIGRALIKMLGEQQYNVFALDSEALQGPAGPQITKYYRQDITSSFKIEEYFDHVFHLGALNVTHVGRADYQDYYHVNVQGTKNLIEAVETQQFVFMSTVKVYQRKEGVIDEASPVGPKGDYERSKFEAEEVCRQYFDEKNLTIFRSTNVVGPGQAEKAVIPVFFKRALNNESLEIIHPERTLLHMLYIGDVVQAFYLLLQKGQGIGVINLCSGETITLGDLAREVVSICRSTSKIQLTSNEKGIQMQYTSNKSLPALGWQAQTPLKTILKNYYNHVSART